MVSGEESIVVAGTSLVTMDNPGKDPVQTFITGSSHDNVDV
jgi:hypothetical protein